MEGEYERAIEWYSKALEVDNLAEELYQGLIVCNFSLGLKTEALKAYQRCRDTLSEVIGIEPSLGTEKLYKEILSKS
jgi:DNA-binding SARP family transcriptional activator